MRNVEQLRHSAAMAEAASVRAKQLVENPDLRDAFARLAENYQRAWENAATTEEREEWFFRLRGLRQLQGDLAAVISGGHVAAFNTRHLSK